MTGKPPQAVGGYLRFLAWVAAGTALIALLGAVPTLRLRGPHAVPALIAGCLVGAAGSALGGLVIALRRGGAPADQVNSVLMAMLARLVTVGILGAVVVLSGGFDRTVLLLWIAISYAALLVVDTRYALSGLAGTDGKR